MLSGQIIRQLIFRHSALRGLSSCHLRYSHNDPGLSLHYKNDIAIIHIYNRKENRMNSIFLKEFHSLLDKVEGNTSCKGLVTVGEGKFYSNGLDLDWMTTVSAQELLDFMSCFQKTLLRVLILPVPTLAVINGHAFAGGAVLAFAHDLRTMNSEKGWISFNEVLLNKVFSPFLKEFLRIKLGDGKNVSDALVLGRSYTARDALDNNLLHSVHSPLSLLDESLQVLESFIGSKGYPRKSLLKIKKDLYQLPLQAYETESKEKQPYFSVQFMTSAQLSELKESPATI